MCNGWAYYIGELSPLLEITVVVDLLYVQTDETIFLPSGETARVEMPEIPLQFTGTGDLFSALLLAWSGKGGLQVTTHFV